MKCWYVDVSIMKTICLSSRWLLQIELINLKNDLIGFWVSTVSLRVKIPNLVLTRVLTHVHNDGGQYPHIHIHIDCMPSFAVSILTCRGPDRINLQRAQSRMCGHRQCWLLPSQTSDLHLHHQQDWAAVEGVLPA